MKIVKAERLGQTKVRPNISLDKKQIKKKKLEHAKFSLMTLHRKKSLLWSTNSQNPKFHDSK